MKKISMIIILLLLVCACNRGPKYSVTLVNGETEKIVSVRPGSVVTGKMKFDGLEDNTLWCTEEDGRGEVIVNRAGMVLYPVAELIVIKTVEDFALISEEVRGVYLLANDIKITGEWESPTELVSLGFLSYGQFEGVFHGAGHSVTGIKQTKGDKTGLFGFMQSAYIRDLHVEGEIDIADYEGSYGGLLAGVMEHSEIINVSVSGTISLSAPKAPLMAGGIAGWFYKSKIRNSSALVKIVLNNSEHGYEADRVGGLTGYNLWSLVEDCYAVSDITVKSRNTGYAGGISGHNYLSRIFRTHASANITHDYEGQAEALYLPGLSTDGSISLGGITGFNNVYDVSSNVVRELQISTNATPGIAVYTGRIAGQMYGPMEQNLSDEAISLNPAATALTTDDDQNKTDNRKTKGELALKQSYEAIGWDFENTWKIGEEGYPVLR